MSPPPATQDAAAVADALNSVHPAVKARAIGDDRVQLRDERVSSPLADSGVRPGRWARLSLARARALYLKDTR